MSSKIAAAAAAVILLAASCGEESPSITAPTAPSPISTTTQAAPPQLAGAADGTAMPADPGEIAFNEPQYRASSYTYTPGVPGNPRHVQVRATGDSYVATIDNETLYEHEISWEAPNWGATEADEFRVQVRSGDNVLAHAVMAGNPALISPETVDLEAAEGRFYMALCNNIGCSPEWDAGWIVIGDATNKPGPPGEMSIAEKGITGGPVTIDGRQFETERYGISATLDQTDFVTDIEVEYWATGARREIAIKDRYEIAPRATGFNVTFDVPEGKWTVVARSRNSRGWGIRGVKRANVEVEYGISTPGRPTNLAWNNSRISWDPPLDNGGLPLQKYEYFPATMCPSIAGTPYPLDIRDRYTLKNHQVRVHWSPTIDGISMRAWNNAGPSPCINHEF